MSGTRVDNLCRIAWLTLSFSTKGFVQAAQVYEARMLVTR